MASPIVGPIPPFSNPPIQPQFYAPSKFTISDVTLGQTTIVTATEDMNYDIGQLVRLIIPSQFGCIQLNEQQGFVLSLPAADQVEVSIDSSQNVDAFTTSSATTKPQIVPVGDINSGQINSSGRINLKIDIPGSFINISPE